MEPCGTRVESLQSFVEPCETSGPTALAESCGTLKPSSNHPGPPRSPRRTLWDPVKLCWNGTFPKNLVEPWWNPRPEHGGTRGNLVLTSNHPAALAEPGETLAEFWWKSGGTLVEPSEPWWNPGGTLVKPSSNPQPSKKLVEPWWNPRETLPQTTQTTPPLQNPGGTLVKPWWNPGGTLVERGWNSGGTPGGTLVEP